MPRGGRLDAHAVGVGDLHRRPAGDDLERLADLAGDEVGADPEGRGRHAARCSSKAWRVSSAGSVMPTLARPSVRRRTRLTPLSARWSATCSAPRSQPPQRLVVARASISAGVGRAADGGSRPSRAGSRPDVDLVVRFKHFREVAPANAPSDALRPDPTDLQRQPQTRP